jgi:ribose 1,5-bisphosphokinase
MGTERIGPGRLVVVVGPSGAGKDSILRAARTVLSARAAVFPRRFITREAGDPSEDHIPISATAFGAAEAAGVFALTWDAHGLKYGIPRAADDMLRAGFTVVFNASRTVIPRLRERMPIS